MDLRSKRDIGTILCKAILAMSNRDPDDASHTMNGRGIVVIGVEPGAVHGVIHVDNADLDKLVTTYIGQDGPRWQPVWDKVQGHDVLIVVVDAPSWGDPIWTLRKQIGNYGNGTIFVRKRARSEPADSENIARLSDRLTHIQSNRSLDIDVAVRTARPLSRIRPSDEGLDEYLAEIRQRLMKPLTEYKRERKAARGQGFPFSALGETPVEALLKATKVSPVFGSKPESRTEEQYKLEVERHVKSLREQMPSALWRTAARRIPAPAFVVRNRSDRNLKQLAVELYIPGDIRGQLIRETPKDLDEVLPPGPRPWGPIEPSIIPRHLVTMPTTRSLGDVTPQTKIRNGGSVMLTFLPIDVRPKQTVVLDTNTALLVPDSRTEAVIAEWKATALDTDGVATGKFEVPFDGGVFALRVP